MCSSNKTSLNELYKIGTVQFLNSVPLTWKIETIAESLNMRVSLTPDTPSNLADALVRGEYDVALIPIAEAVRHPELMQVSDTCIASEGGVASIKFIAFRPLSEIRCVGLDAASRTSNALIRICLRERFKLVQEIDYTTFNLGTALGRSVAETEDINLSQDNLAELLADTCKKMGIDGVLLIGDKALFAPHWSSYFSFVYDLGQVWTQWTGLPFVFASWFVRPGMGTLQLSTLFNESRRASQVEMDILTLHEAMRRKMPITECHDYLTRRIRFRLGNRERRGAEVFCKLMQKYSLAPLGSSLIFEADRKR